MAKRAKRRSYRRYAPMKRSYRRAKKGIGGFKPLMTKAAIGIGAGTVITSLLNLVPGVKQMLPVNDQVIGLASAYYFGGIEGAVANVLLSGGGLNLSGFFPGNVANGTSSSNIVN